MAQRKPVLACMANAAASGGYDVSAPVRRWGAGQHADGQHWRGGHAAEGGETAGPGAPAHAHTFTRATHRPFSPTVPLTDNERANWHETVDDGYRLFVQRVADGRKMREEKVRELAGGRVWLGSEARERGMVDHTGGLVEVVARARELAGLAPRPRRTHVVGDRWAPSCRNHGRPHPRRPLEQVARPLIGLLTPRAWAWLPWPLPQ